MHSQLNHKIHLKIGGCRRGPIWILFVYVCALSASANNAREPVLIPKKNVCEDGGEAVEY
jgi:hypothetical protein